MFSIYVWSVCEYPQRFGIEPRIYLNELSGTSTCPRQNRIWVEGPIYLRVILAAS